MKSVILDEDKLNISKSNFDHLENVVASKKSSQLSMHLSNRTTFFLVLDNQSLIFPSTEFMKSYFFLCLFRWRQIELIEVQWSVHFVRTKRIDHHSTDMLSIPNRYDDMCNYLCSAHLFWSFYYLITQDWLVTVTNDMIFRSTESQKNSNNNKYLYLSMMVMWWRSNLLFTLHICSGRNWITAIIDGVYVRACSLIA